MNILSKKEFLELDINKKIDYLNSRLNEGQTVIRIREDIGIGEKALQKIVKKNGYKYDTKTKTYKPIAKLSDDKDMTTVIDDNSMTISVPENLKSNLINLAMDYDKLKYMLDWFENKDDKGMTSVIEVVSKGIAINLPSAENTRTTVRVNSDTLKRFDIFCKEHKEFSKQDLLSQALEDFMIKHEDS